MFETEEFRTLRRFGFSEWSLSAAGGRSGTIAGRTRIPNWHFPYLRRVLQARRAPPAAGARFFDGPIFLPGARSKSGAAFLTNSGRSRSIFY
jgi:hypothetical protein